MGEDNLKNINYKLPGHDCLLHDSTSSRFAQASPSCSAVRVLVLCPLLQGAEHLPQAVQGPTAQETEKVNFLQVRFIWTSPKLRWEREEMIRI